MRISGDDVAAKILSRIFLERATDDMDSQFVTVSVVNVICNLLLYTAISNIKLALICQYFQKMQLLSCWHTRPLPICLVLTLALLCTFYQSADASVTKGQLSVSAKEGFAYGGKFCFQNMPTYSEGVGRVEVDLVARRSESLAIRFVAYDDQDESWPTLLANWDKWSCQEKVNHAKFSRSYPACTPYLAASESCWRPLSGSNDQSSLTIVIDTITQVTRPRYWFFAFASCEGALGTGVAPAGIHDLSYHFHFTQSHSSKWSAEFGMNERDLNSLYFLAFIAFSLLLCLHAYGTYLLHEELSYLHPLLKLFLLVLLLEYFAVVAGMVHYLTYTRDGVGMTSLKNFGQVCELFSRALFIFLLMLLARGWTLSSKPIASSVWQTYRRRITILIGCYTALSLLVVLWNFFNTNPMRTSPSATMDLILICINLLWLCFALYFLYQLYDSWQGEHTHQKKRMYLLLGTLFLPWLFLPPIANLLIVFLDPWVREKIVISFNLIASLLAYSLMSFLFWPTRAEQYFAIATPDTMFGDSMAGEYEQL